MTAAGAFETFFKEKEEEQIVKKDLIFPYVNSVGRRKYVIGFRIIDGGDSQRLLVAWAKPAMSKKDKFDYKKGVEIVINRLDRMSMPMHMQYEPLIGQKIPFNSMNNFYRIMGKRSEIPYMILNHLEKHAARAVIYFKQIKDWKNVNIIIYR